MSLGRGLLILIYKEGRSLVGYWLSEARREFTWMGDSDDDGSLEIVIRTRLRGMRYDSSTSLKVYREVFLALMQL